MNRFSPQDFHSPIAGSARRGRRRRARRGSRAVPASVVAAGRGGREVMDGATGGHREPDSAPRLGRKRYVSARRGAGRQFNGSGGRISHTPTRPSGLRINTL
jgi:hypothetical protein